MDKITAIENRHSVRMFKDISIESEIIDSLEEEIEICNKMSGLNIQLVTNESEAFEGFMAHYGHFSGVKNYIAMVGEDSKLLEEKVGYYGERIAIKACMLGLGTCWVALSYSKRRTQIEINEGEKLVCVIAIGYAENQGQPHRYRPIEKIANLSDDDPNWYREGIRLARLAPTAMNQQKYYIERSGNVVKIVPGLGFYTKVDVGIVRYHFEVGAGKQNFKWHGEAMMEKEIRHQMRQEKNVLIISSSPRKNGNSDRLCQEFAKGAEEAGHHVKTVRVAEKNIGFCTGCYACGQTGKCYHDDDMNEIIPDLIDADVIVFASPVYFYNMSGQLKVFIDRLLPCYHKIRADIYLIATANDEDISAVKKSLDAIRGLTYDCLEACEEKGRIIACGVDRIGDIENRPELKLAYQMGKNC